MSLSIQIILLSGWAGVCSVWFVLLIAQRRVCRDRLILEPDASGDPPVEAGVTSWPSIAVIVPARNEAPTLDACIQSLLNQDYPDLRIVIVDDRSRDATFDAAQRIAGRDPRVRVERVTELPAGWMGKSYALWTGSRAVDADWLLFVDADCTLHPRAVRAAVADALRRCVDLLSLWPRHDARTFWEHMLIPLCGGIIALWFGSRAWQEAERGPAFANGQFLLVRRDVYEQIGGHRSVRQALIEDIPLAEHARASGLRTHVAAGHRIAAVRMYDHYAAIRDGWARIYVGALRSAGRILLSMAWLLFGSLLPFVMLPTLFVASSGALSSPPTWTVAVVLCITHLVLVAVVSYRFWGLGECRRVYLLLYPISVVIVMRILAQAWWWITVRGRVPWRDQLYAIDRRGRLVG